MEKKEEKFFFVEPEWLDEEGSAGDYPAELELAAAMGRYQTPIDGILELLLQQ